MKKFLKRLVFGILGLLLFVVLLASGLLFWIIKNPQQAWDQAEKRFFPKDLKITWESVYFKGDRISGLNFDIDFAIEKLKITKGQPALSIPLDHMAVKISILPKDVDKKIVIHNVEAKSSEVISVHLEKPEKKEPDKNPYQQVQAILTKVEKLNRLALIEKLNIDVANFSFASGDTKPLVLSLKAEQLADKNVAQKITFESALKLPASKPISLGISGELKLPNLGSESPFLTAKLKVHGAGIRTEQNIEVTSQSRQTLLTSDGRIQYALEKKTLLLEPKLKIKMNDSEAVTHVDASFSGLPGPLVNVDHFKFEMKTPLEQDVTWSEKPSIFESSAPIALFFIDSKMRKPLEKSCECKIPEVLLVQVKGKAWLADILSTPTDSKPALDGQISVESVHNKLLSVDMSAKVKVEKKSSQWTITPALDFEGSINSFQGLRKFLDAKNILIPAPLSLLEGTIKISSHDLVKTTEKDYVLPVSVVTTLASQHQDVNVTTDTVVKLTSNFKEMFVDVVAKIDSLQLELPPLDPIRGKPRVTMDKRILKEPPKAKPKPSNFKVFLNLSVETTKPAAIRLLSKYFQPNLPLTIAVHRSQDKDNTGFIQTEPFRIEYLRRKVEVEKMRIDLPPSETEPIPVDARFKIRQTDYTVYINLVGPINKPDISLTSEPYLPESDIISVLLYDRVSKDLVGGDAETTGNVQAAMADKAIGLFGLWAFAATPIKSFTYNPVTKVYSATVAVTDDVTAGIGTNWEEATRLELRKRVSKSWVLTAAWVPATQDEDQKTDLVLQWEKRF